MTATILKLIACVTMLIDHTGAVFESELPYFMRCIGRTAFPLFVFLAAESCVYTKSKYRYWVRLAIFALISEIPFDLAFGHGGDIEINFLTSTNVFYTLAIGVLAVCVYEGLKNKRWIYLCALNILPAMYFSTVYANKQYVFVGFSVMYAAVLVIVGKFGTNKEDEANKADKLCAFVAAAPVCFLGQAFDTDYGMVGAAMVFLIYLAKTKPLKLFLSACGIAYFYIVPVFRVVANGHTPSAWYIWFNVFAFLSVVLMMAYNGKRGGASKGTKLYKVSQIGFYVFYPAHISVLIIIRAMLNINV